MMIYAAVAFLAGGLDLSSTGWITFVGCFLADAIRWMRMEDRIQELEMEVQHGKRGQ